MSAFSPVATKAQTVASLKMLSGRINIRRDTATASLKKARHALCWRRARDIGELAFESRSERDAAGEFQTRSILVFEDRPVADLSLADPRQCCV
jgi:hypothetical protein